MKILNIGRAAAFAAASYVVLSASAGYSEPKPYVAAGAPATAPAAAPAMTPTPPAPPPMTMPPAPPPPPAMTTVRVLEGTEVRVRFNDKLSSATSVTGDEFSITLDEPITLANGVVIPAGYHGKGVVSQAEKKGMMGKAGQLNVRFDYIKVGDTRIHIRGSKGQEGASGVGTAVVLTVLFGPIGLLKHGKDVDIPAGQTMQAYVDGDAIVPLPLADAPPN